jgi:hypothetical protein
MYRHQFQIVKPALGLLITALLASCGGSSPTATQTVQLSPSVRALPQITAEMDATLASIVTEVGTPLASDLSQCGALPAGAKACGGPSRYIVYSRQVSNEGRLRGLAEKYTNLERELNTLSQLASTCSIIMAPTVNLAAGKCQAK